MANLALIFDLIGRDQGASRTFKSVGDSAESAANRTGNAVGRLNGAFEGMTGAAKAFLGAGLVAGFAGLYNAAAESAKIGRLTESTIRATGGAAGITADQVGDLATAISNKTGADDEAIQSGENLLLTFTRVRNEAGKGNDVFDQATQLALDMSTALGSDMSNASIMLGKALNDPIKGITALSRAGVSFTQEQKDQIRTLVESGRVMDAQKIILGELKKEFGGAAEAAATPFDKLQVKVGNLAEQVGGYLIPAVDTFADFMSHDVLPAAEDVGDVVGGVLGPALHLAGEALGFIYDVGKGAVDLFRGLPEPVQLTVGALAAAAALKGPVGSLLSTIGDFAETAALKVLFAKDAISGLGGAGGVAKAGLGGLVGFLGGPWGIALSAATVGLSLLISWLNDTDEATAGATEAQQGLADALRQSRGAIDDNVRAAAAKVAQDEGLLDAADAVGISLAQVTDAVLGQGNAYNEVMTELVRYRDAHTDLNGERTKEAQQVSESILVLQDLAGTTDENITSAEQLGRATADSAASMGTATAAGQTLETQLQDLSDTASDGRKQIDLLKTSLDVLTGDSVSLLEAQSALNDAIDAGTDALKDEGGAVLDASGALNTHTENGRAAADVLLDIRNRGNDLIATMIQQGATTEDVTKADADLRASFIKTAGEMGIGADAANNLADQILGIPSSRTTTIIADTGQAQDTINKLVTGINSQGLIGIIRTIGGKADGGTIDGWSPHSRADNILIAATAGEFMQPVRSVRKYGTGFMESVRSGRFPVSLARGFADGGYINYPSSADFLAMVDMTPAAKGKLQQAFSGPGPGAGSGVQRWSSLVLQALQMMGQPSSLLGTTLRRMNQESGGNPRAINNWDINAKRGDPSRGLMQTIGSTFRAYHFPGTSWDIYDPLANVLASMRYALARYGSLAAAYNRAGGYKLGTDFVPEDGLAYLHRGEAVVPADKNQGAPYTGGGPLVIQLDGPATVDLLEGRAVSVAAAALEAVTARGAYNS